MTNRELTRRERDAAERNRGDVLELRRDRRRAAKALRKWIESGKTSSSSPKPQPRPVVAAYFPWRTETHTSVRGVAHVSNVKGLQPEIRPLRVKAA